MHILTTPHINADGSLLDRLKSRIKKNGEDEVKKTWESYADLDKTGVKMSEFISFHRLMHKAKTQEAKMLVSLYLKMKSDLVELENSLVDCGLIVIDNARCTPNDLIEFVCNSLPIEKSELLKSTRSSTDVSTAKFYLSGLLWDILGMKPFEQASALKIHRSTATHRFNMHEKYMFTEIAYRSAYMNTVDAARQKFNIDNQK